MARGRDRALDAIAAVISALAGSGSLWIGCALLIATGGHMRSRARPVPT